MTQYKGPFRQSENNAFVVVDSEDRVVYPEYIVACLNAPHSGEAVAVERAIHLYTEGDDTCVAVEDGLAGWVEVIRTNATNISYFVERSGVLAKLKAAQFRCDECEGVGDHADGCANQMPATPAHPPITTGSEGGYQQKVYAWLGRWRDFMPFDAVHALQDILGPLSTAPSAPVGDDWTCPHCPMTERHVHGKQPSGDAPPSAAGDDDQHYPFGYIDENGATVFGAFPTPAEGGREEAAKYCESLALAYFTPSGGPYFPEAEHDAALLRLAAAALRKPKDIRYDEFLAAAKARGYADLTALVEAHDALRRPVVDEVDAVLPYKVKFPGMSFGKGVKLSTLVGAATRWLKAARSLSGNTVVPGIKAHERIVSDECRRNAMGPELMETSHGIVKRDPSFRSDRSAFDEAISTARQALFDLSKHHSIGSGAKFHVVVTVDSPANRAALAGEK